MAQITKTIRNLTSSLIVSVACCGAAHADTVKVGGTGAAMGTMKELGNAFVQLHPEHHLVEVPSLGSNGGIKALQSGVIQLAVSGRDLTPDEKASGLTATRYGTSPFIFVTHKNVKLPPLTKAMVADIYSGKQQHWPNGRPIRLVLRPRNEGDTLLVKKISTTIEIAVNAALARPGMVVAITDIDSADQIEKFPESFGASTLALVLSEKRQLNVLPLDGVTPSVSTLKNGSYPYAKEMYAILPKNATPATVEFIKFVKSVEGRVILQKLGHQVYFPQ